MTVQGDDKQNRKNCLHCLSNNDVRPMIILTEPLVSGQGSLTSGQEILTSGQENKILQVDREFCWLQNNSDQWSRKY